MVAESPRDRPALVAQNQPAASRDTPLVVSEPGPAADPADGVESLPHEVQSGENFWTVSQLYYGSGRYYKALWASNKSPAR